jgi:hypothetical protein
MAMSSLRPRFLFSFYRPSERLLVHAQYIAAEVPEIFRVLVSPVSTFGKLTSTLLRHAKEEIIVLLIFASMEINSILLRIEPIPLRIGELLVNIFKLYQIHFFSQKLRIT